MAQAGMNYNPTAVLMGRPQSTMLPYINSGKQGPPTKRITNDPAPPPAGTLAPATIRATGNGPFDSAYRQNLATYAGGQFQRPVGGLNFNPTDLNTFPGQPTGGGNAPVTGMPNTLLDAALGGQSFSWAPPPAQPATSPSGSSVNPTLQDWLKQFLMNTRLGVSAY